MGPFTHGRNDKARRQLKNEEENTDIVITGHNDNSPVCTDLANPDNRSQAWDTVVVVGIGC